MALRVLRVNAFENPNELEMFRRIEEELRTHLSHDEESVLLGAPSVDGKRLDGLLIRSKSITVIEQKDFDGDIIGPENGPWFCNPGKIPLNKGREENPFMQVGTYRRSVASKLRNGRGLGDQREAELRSRWISFVSGLVVFRRLRSYTSTIDPRIAIWFNATDLDRISDAVEGIFSNSIQLSATEIEVVADILTDDYYSASKEKAIASNKESSRLPDKPLDGKRGLSFKGINKTDVESALSFIDKHGVPGGRNSKKWVLSINGREYPPKYVMTKAGYFANGVDLDHNNFGARTANEFLLGLKYTILDKKTGKIWAR